MGEQWVCVPARVGGAQEGRARTSTVSLPLYAHPCKCLTTNSPQSHSRQWTISDSCKELSRYNKYMLQFRTFVTHTIRCYRLMENQNVDDNAKFGIHVSSNQDHFKPDQVT